MVYWLTVHFDDVSGGGTLHLSCNWEGNYGPGCPLVLATLKSVRLLWP